MKNLINMRNSKIIIILSFAVLAVLVVLGLKNHETKWRTYQNHEAGYAIDYPGDWFLRTEDEILFIESTEKPLYFSSGFEPENIDEFATNGYSISIVGYKNTQNLSLKKYIQEIFNFNAFESKEVLIGQIEAIEAHEKDAWISYLPHYFLYNNSYIYEIRCRDERSDLEQLAKNIVESFRILK